MEEAKRFTTRIFLSSDSYFRTYIRTSATEIYTVPFGVAQITEDELARTVGKRVTIRCHREKPTDLSCHSARLFVDGRELTRGKN